MILNYKNVKIYYKIIKREKDNSLPLLFLHGWGMDISSFKYFYEKVAFNCILVDFPPFGKSTEPQQEFILLDYAKIILKILDKLKINKVNIVAHSFGGRVAIELAASTNLVNKMLLTGSAGIKVFNFKRFLKIKKYKFLKFMSKLKLFSKSKLNKYGSADYSNLSITMKKTFINIVNYNQKKLLKKIQVPTLLVWGNLDKETPFCFTKIFKKSIKDCEVIAFDNCSHFAYLERPQLFLSILNSFFT